MSFDKIISNSVGLRSEVITLEASNGDGYKFTVHELSPIVIGMCLDEFGEVDFRKIICRSVVDQDGRKMSMEQANRLDPKHFAKIMEAYSKFHPATDEPKKKVTVTTKKKTK